MCLLILLFGGLGVMSTESVISKYEEKSIHMWLYVFLWVIVALGLLVFANLYAGLITTQICLAFYILAVVTTLSNNKVHLTRRKRIEHMIKFFCTSRTRYNSASEWEKERDKQFWEQSSKTHDIAREIDRWGKKAHRDRIILRAYKREEVRYIEACGLLSFSNYIELRTLCQNSKNKSRLVRKIEKQNKNTMISDAVCKELLNMLDDNLVVAPSSSNTF